jgi:hypothetical protein
MAIARQMILSEQTRRWVKASPTPRYWAPASPPSSCAKAHGTSSMASPTDPQRPRRPRSPHSGGCAVLDLSATERTDAFRI